MTASIPGAPQTGGPHGAALRRQRVLVTGGTGVLGAMVLPELHAAGRDVLVTARPDGSGPVGTATSIAVSLFERAALAEVFDDVTTVMHLATRIPAGPAAVDATAWYHNDRLRADATASLVDAALEAGVTTFVYPSVTYLYADGGARWLWAGAPVSPSAVLRSSLEAELEVARFAAHPGRRGVVLRLGGLYGPSSSITRAALAAAGRGEAPVPGPDGAYTPTLWERDAGSALAAAVDAPSGVYDVVDDDPLPRAAVNELYRAATNQPPQLAQPTGGDELTRTALAFLLRSHRVTNASYRQVTGWRPSVPSLADAVPELARIANGTTRTRPTGRVAPTATTTTE